MDRSRFLALLLVSSLLFLSFTNGFFGRVMTQTVDDDEHQHSKENSGKLRKLMMAEVMDYGDPEANTNPKYGDLFTPPSPEVGAPSP